MRYSEKVEALFAEIHQDVKDLLDPAKQKRTFPKKALTDFLNKKKIREQIQGNVPEVIRELAASDQKLNLVPTEILRTFFADQDIWDLLPDSIQNALAEDRDPRVPSQGSSDFVINRELGDWAEKMILAAINATEAGVKAVHYGRQDKLIAGQAGFDALYQEHHAELKAIGKRPDLLIFNDDTSPAESLVGRNAQDLTDIAKRAKAGFEVRSSQQAIHNDDRLAKLSFTPKIEDIAHVLRWIKIHNVPHFYVQVLFGRVYAIPFTKILEILKDSPKSKNYRVARLPQNQFKSTIYIPLSKGVLLSSNFEKPSNLTATTKELTNGRVVVVVTFAGGKIELNPEALNGLLRDAAN
jgi:hypothetical protein